MSPELVQAISGLGALGFAIIGVWAFATGRVVRGSEVGQLRAERDEWKALHTSALSRIDRLTDAVERLTGTVDRIDARRTENIEEVAQRIVKALKP